MSRINLIEKNFDDFKKELILIETEKLTEASNLLNGKV